MRNRTLVAVAFAALACAAHGQVVYHMTDIGDLAIGTAAGYAMNESAQITGWSGGGAFLYSGSSMKCLGSLGGSFCSGYAISSNGLVAGYVEWPSQVRHAIYFDGTTLRDIGALPGDTDSEATGVNAQGTAVGCSNIYGIWHAFVYSNSTIMPLGTLGGAWSKAYAINDSAQIVGTSSLPGDVVSHAFLYSGGVMHDIGSLGGSAEATAISPNGLVAGRANVPPGTVSHAFFYAGGSMHDLGAFGGTDTFPWAVNSAGQIVGYSRYGYAGNNPFLYSPTLGMLDIRNLVDSSQSGYALSEAWGINSKGWILCRAFQGQHERAVLLKPLPIPPLSIQTLRGSLTGGGLSDLLASDDSWVTWRPGVVLSSAEAPVDVIVSATSPVATPTMVSFTLEAHANVSNIGQTISLFNYQSNNWEQVDFRQATLTDGEAEITISPAGARFVNPSDRSMRVRIQYKATGPILAYPWQVSMDHTFWAVSP